MTVHKRILIAMIACCVCMTTRGEGGQASHDTLLEGRVAHWKFNETEDTAAKDVSGNGHTATLVRQADFAPRLMGNAVRLEL